MKKFETFDKMIKNGNFGIKGEEFSYAVITKNFGDILKNRY